jgi:uncharacterized protein (DUF58 family)
MLPQEIFKKVRKIEIITRKLVQDVFSGEYHSTFKGQGMEFSEVREYSIGDDIRMIDWNVTARMGSPYVKKFVEERELTVFILIDMSASSKFGTKTQLKSEIAAEISALLSFSAIKNNDKVGMIIFTNKIEKYIPPKKGRTHILRIIREILLFKPESKETDLNVALNYLNKITKRRAIVFLISDFISPDFYKAIAVTNKKHDLIAITLKDPREKSLPKAGFIFLEDAETSEELIIESFNPLFHKKFNEITNQKDKELEKIFNKMNIDYIKIDTEKPYINPLIAFFKMRERRARF